MAKSQMQDEKPSRLLALPAEMKNAIYRYALVQEDPIPCTADTELPSEPALLRTCQEVRTDATSFYYVENCFAFRICDYDASHLVGWAIKSPKHQAVTYRLELMRPAPGSWNNLMSWLEVSWRLGVRGPSADTSWTGPHKITAKMFSIVKKEKLRGATWSEIVSVLEDVKEALKEAGADWI